MIILYITIFFIVLGITIWGFKSGGYSPMEEFAAIGGVSVTVSMGLLSFMPLWDTGSKTFDAIGTKVGDEIIVHSLGLPTQIVSDIKFIDKPLVIVKQTNKNLYGLGETNTYTVNLKK